MKPLDRHPPRPDVDDLVVVLLLCPAFAWLFHFLRTDLNPPCFRHKSSSSVRGRTPHALYYLLLNTLTAFGGNGRWLVVAAVLVLSSATTLKYAVTKKLLA